MTRTPAPALSSAEAAIVARFDAAPVPPEVLVENVARAIWDALPDSGYGRKPWADLSKTTHFLYRSMAAAAIAALPPSPAEEAVKRVEALAEEFDSATLPPLINDFDRGLVAGCARAAARLRAALASPAPAPQDGAR